DLLLRETGDSDIHVLRRRFYTEEYPRPRVAAFSKIVDQAAAEGDAVAAAILQGAACDLLNITGVVRRRLFAPSDTLNVAYIGAAGFERARGCFVSDAGAPAGGLVSDRRKTDSKAQLQFPVSEIGRRTEDTDLRCGGRHGSADGMGFRRGPPGSDIRHPSRQG